MSGPLIDWSDDDLRAGIRTTSVHVTYAYNDYVRELERRVAVRQARDSRLLSVVSVVIAVVALVVSALRA
jgi:hypothetical protein